MNTEKSQRNKKLIEYLSRQNWKHGSKIKASRIFHISQMRVTQLVDRYRNKYS